MSPEQYQQWVKELPQLSVGQLSELSTRIKLLSKTATNEHTGKQEFGDRVLQAVCDVMKRNNLETPHPVTLKKSSAYVNAKAKIEDLSTYFEKISHLKLVQDSILKVAIELLLFDMLQWQGVAVSSHSLLKQAHRIPSMLNRAFPGYAQSGFLTKIVKGANESAS